MYAWGENGRLFRSGTSNVPDPPDTAVADTMNREREALPDFCDTDDDSVISIPDSEHHSSGAQSEASLSETMFYPVSANATHAEAISGSSLPPLPRKGQTKEEREEWWKGQTEGRSRGSGGQGMSQLQEDQEGKDSNKNRSRGQQRLNRSPSRKRRSPSRKSRERPSPSPSRKSPSPSRKSSSPIRKSWPPSPSRKRPSPSRSTSPSRQRRSPSPSRKSPSPSRKRRKVQAKQETAQPRESQSQEKQECQWQRHPSPSGKRRSPSRKSRSRGESFVGESRSPSGKSRSPSRKSRSRGQLHAKTGCQLFLGLKEGLCERKAIGVKTQTSIARDPTQPLPASVGLGNLMVATWAVGRDCCTKDLGEKLCNAPFDFILLLMSSAVAEGDDIYSFLHTLSSVQALPPEERITHPMSHLAHGKATWTLLLRVLEEKSVHCLGGTTHGRSAFGSAFVALHKAKITNAFYEQCHIRSRGPDSGIHFGTLRLTMDQSRQRMAEVKVGIIDVRTEVNIEDTDALVAWAVLHRIDMLTGFFGNHHLAEFVSDLATRTRAISWTPLFQAIRSRGESFVHPSFFLFFGFYRAIKVPEDDPQVSDTLQLGRDIWNDMVRLEDMPQWPRNDEGSAFVRNLGTLKMKAPDWKRWFHGCFQTCLWLGTSTPSSSSQEKQRLEESEGKTKGKHKGKDKPYVLSVKGKDKGKDKRKNWDRTKGEGKTKGKDKGKGKGKYKGWRT